MRPTQRCGDEPEHVTVLCGGVGAARLLRGLVRVVPPRRITAIVNTGDDMVLHGLHISPDLDTCTYTLADAINPETGWGLVDETWNARTGLERYGGETWFGLGDRDLATHMYRTQRLSEGRSLSQVTAEITRAWGLEVNLVPMTDQSVSTRVTVAGGETLDFQRYFVERGHQDPVTAVAFESASTASPAPGVIEALRDADRVLIAPSNPIVSIAPILAISGIAAVLESRRETVVGISPIIGGRAVKGPAADMLGSLGHRASAVGVAEIYREIVGHWVIDNTDAQSVDAVAELGIAAHVTETRMSSPEIAAALSTTALNAPTVL